MDRSSTTTPPTHRRRRGFSVLETLIVLAIGAGIIGAAAGTVREVVIRNQANNIQAAMSEFERNLNEHLRRRHVEDTTCTAAAHGIGTEVTPAILAGATPWNAAPCDRLWRSWVTAVLNSTPEVDPDPTAEVSSYDADNRREFFIGSEAKGYDVGFAINSAAGRTAATWAGVAPMASADADLVALVATTGALNPECPTNAKVLMAVAVDSEAACETAVERLIDNRWRQAVACIDPAGGFTGANVSFVQGDAALLACYD